MFEDHGRAIIDLSDVRERRARLPADPAGALEFQNLVLSERLTELEIELENNWWIRLVDRADRDFSRPALRAITRMARLVYLKNPLIHRAIEVQAHYVYGQGMSIRARSPLLQAVIEDFLGDRTNQQALTGQQARIRAERQRAIDGNLFVVHFPDPHTGRVRVRTIPFDQIEEIVTNPEDRQEPWYYKRQWEEQRLDPASGQYQPTPRVAYYPDVNYQPSQRPATIGEHPVLWESPVRALQTGGTLDMAWGVPDCYSALDWALAYKQMLENDATRSAALARFAWTLTQKNSTAASRAAAKADLGTTIGVGDNGMAIETNPPPLTGATFITSDANRLQPVNISGAMPNPDHARPHRLMVAAGTGLPETFFGDSDVGNHATAKALDRPTELRMRMLRELWTDFWQGLIDYVVDWAIRAPSGRLRPLARPSRDPFGEARLEAIDPETGEPLDRYVEVAFPDLLEHDVAARVNAIVAAATLSGFQPAGTIPADTTSELLLAALGLDDISEIMEALAEEHAAAPPPAPATPPAAPAQPRESLVAAVRELREAVLALRPEAP